ncbi:MAG: hypothetical protein WC556_06875 [Candidatus Methanoperedens sp.]
MNTDGTAMLDNLLSFFMNLTTKSAKDAKIIVAMLCALCGDLIRLFP